MSDESAWFREVTFRICGDLELAAAFPRAVDALRTAIPATSASLHVYERDLGAVRTIATAPPGAQAAPIPVAALSEEARRVLDATAGERVSLYAQVDDHRVTAEMAARQAGRGPASVLVLRLALSGERLGALVLVAEGPERFSDAHAGLLRTLHEPFALALSHAVRTEAAERLREQLADEGRDLHPQRRLAGDAVVGADFGLREVMDLVRKVAPTTAPVLLLGETGVGKEVVADALHRLSSRARGPLVRVNCGALPQTLIDSELFGHEQGAFTGAMALKRGRFERAQGGTLFLDEIGELPLEAQARLLRVLQGGEFERVGGTQPLRADVRVVAATHRDLEAMVAEGRFRADLRFRLSVFPIRIPPLRERSGDLPALTHHFLERKARELGLGARPTLAPGAIDQLLAYGWPGNVRELQNVLERALLLAQGRPLAFPELGAAPAVAPVLPGPAAVASLDEVIARHLRAALAAAGGRIEGPGGAAALLGLDPSTLRHRLRKHRIPFGRAARG